MEFFTNFHALISHTLQRNEICRWTLLLTKIHRFLKIIFIFVSLIHPTFLVLIDTVGYGTLYHCMANDDLATHTPRPSRTLAIYLNLYINTPGPIYFYFLKFNYPNMMCMVTVNDDIHKLMK